MDYKHQNNIDFKNIFHFKFSLTGTVGVSLQVFKLALLANSCVGQLVVGESLLSVNCRFSQCLSVSFSKTCFLLQ